MGRKHDRQTVGQLLSSECWFSVFAVKTWRSGLGRDDRVFVELEKVGLWKYRGKSVELGACRQEIKSSHAIKKRAEEGSEVETVLSGTTLAV